MVSHETPLKKSKKRQAIASVAKIRGSSWELELLGSAPRAWADLQEEEESASHLLLWRGSAPKTPRGIEI